MKPLSEIKLFTGTYQDYSYSMTYDKDDRAAVLLLANADSGVVVNRTVRDFFFDWDLEMILKTMLEESVEELV